MKITDMIAAYGNRKLGNVYDFVSRMMNDIQDAVEHKGFEQESVCIKIDIEDCYEGCPYIYLEGIREETPKEEKERERITQMIMKQKEEHERREYERLRKKYGK